MISYGRDVTGQKQVKTATRHKLSVEKINNINNNNNNNNNSNNNTIIKNNKKTYLYWKTASV